ncbi:hypothetical protein F5884DRAFT_47668 [Xylogone sp. PMI_703]|nr:hypothetical protein F5884DRAFT_47668 [Xylogone sp. PMI_703]
MVKRPQAGDHTWLGSNNVALEGECGRTRLCAVVPLPCPPAKSTIDTKARRAGFWTLAVLMVFRSTAKNVENLGPRYSGQSAGCDLGLNLGLGAFAGAFRTFQKPCGLQHFQLQSGSRRPARVLVLRGAPSGSPSPPWACERPNFPSEICERDYLDIYLQRYTSALDFAPCIPMHNHNHLILYVREYNYFPDPTLGDRCVQVSPKNPDAAAKTTAS